MMKIKPLSSSFLSLGGVLLISMGIFFIFFRHPLLPEDSRYIGTSLNEIKDKVPGLTGWLQKVFFVLGSFILTTGLFTVYISQTSFRRKEQGIFIIILTGLFASIGSMTIINFIIRSDFKWVLFIFTLPWCISLILYSLNK